MSVLASSAGRRSVGGFFREHLPRQGNLGHLERNVAAVADDLCADLDHILPQRSERSVLELIRQGPCRLWVLSGHPAP